MQAKKALPRLSTEYHSRDPITSPLPMQPIQYKFSSPPTPPEPQKPSHPQFLTPPRHLPFRLRHLIATSLQEGLQSLDSYSMAMATKFVRFVSSFSRASLSPAATLQGGLTAQQCRRFISSTVKDGEGVVKTDVENQRIDASNFINKTRPKCAVVSVGNGLPPDVMMSPSTSASPFPLHFVFLMQQLEN